MRLRVLLLPFALWGCRSPCMAVAPTDLIVSAKHFEVDLLAPSTACSAAATEALFTFHFAAGQPLEFSAPPGSYRLVLRAFSDIDGTTLLGAGCIAQEFSRGQEQCITLTVGAAASDAQVPSDGSADQAILSDQADLGMAEALSPDLLLVDAAIPPDLPSDQASSPDLFSPPDLMTSPNYMFVTSKAYAQGGFNGLAGADQACNTLAKSAGLPGNYVAYLSTSQISALARLGQARGWIRTDGQPFADDSPHLVGALRKIFFPPRFDETGKDVTDDLVATGTSGDGSLAAGSNCSDWTSSSLQDKVAVGYSAAGMQWANAGYSVSCQLPKRIYCFGIDRTVVVSPQKAQGRFAFLSLGTIDGAWGVMPADGHCKSEANSAQLPGTYKALLATTTASAASRFNYGNGTLPWVRPDGIPLAATAADLMTGKLLAALEVTSGGFQLPLFLTGGAATGVPWGNPLQPGSLAETCQNWTSKASADLLVVGNASRSTDSFLHEVFSSCDSQRHVYCLQE